MALVLCLLLAFASAASASNFYMIEDSNTRRLTEDELREWQYEALGYVLNEIYARHGYHFESGSSYARYFVTQEWYRERPQNVKNAEILAELTPIEKSNERLIKRVRADMLSEGDENPEGRGLLPISYSSEDSGMEFKLTDVQSYRVMNVFSGPGPYYYRGSKGRAMASTNGEIWVCGWEGDWLLIQYDMNNGASRVGYVNKKFIDNRAKLDIPKVQFEYRDAMLRTDSELTDDPKKAKNIIGVIRADQKITYLGGYRCEGKNWAYVEAWIDNKKARGFVSAELIQVSD